MTEQQQPVLMDLESIFNSTEQEKEQNQAAQVTPTEQEVAPEPRVEDLLQPKKEEEVVIEEPTGSSEYTQKLRTLLDTGFVENIAINIDGEETFLSDLEVNDEDVFNSILESIKEEKQKELKTKYISKDGIDEVTEKLIEIRKTGASIDELTANNVNAIDQLTNLKGVLDNGEEAEREQLAIDILAQELRNKGLSQKVIQAQISDYVESGELEDQARQVLEVHLSEHKKAIDRKYNEELQRQIREKEEQKEFRKNLQTTYTSLGVPENTRRLLVDNATKLDQNKISNTDKLYFEARNNPEFFAELNYFLNNPQEFKDWVSSKKVVQAKKDIIKKTITITTNKTKPYEKRETNDLNELFNQK